VGNDYEEMKRQTRAMLAAGISGFPFWAHDAGGFWKPPSDAMYRQWSLAMGSFSPIWKPHGPGFRFPWLFSPEAQENARKYGGLRLELLPYTYTFARRAASTGVPIARAMLIQNPTDEESWAADQQYYWGDEILVAPNASDGGNEISVWLPSGVWYDFWTDAKYRGPETIRYRTLTGVLPLFVKAGAIIPRARPMQSTAFWDKTVLRLDVYPGADGEFALLDDDGISEAWRRGEQTSTRFRYLDATRTLEIGATAGTFSGAPISCTYQVRFHGPTEEVNLEPMPVTREITVHAPK
jgi:alpha-glucosidase (family GH31 glycosyl hydrolase)